MSESAELELVADAGVDVRCIYDELLDLRQLGRLRITRASHVEPDQDGNWWADMEPSGGPVLGPFGSRSEALGAERRWLRPDDRATAAPTLTMHEKMIAAAEFVCTRD